MIEVFWYLPRRAKLALALVIFVTGGMYYYANREPIDNEMCFSGFDDYAYRADQKHYHLIEIF